MFDVRHAVVSLAAIEASHCIAVPRTSPREKMAIGGLTPTLR
jgi:hypothetical protein